MAQDDNNDGAFDSSDSTRRRRKLRVMIITMGGARKESMEELFHHPIMLDNFEPPTFAPGIPSRILRNRYEFLRIARDARLIPDHEWQALEPAMENSEYEKYPERFFECLKDVPVATEGRQGSKYDVGLHYSVELWRKAKTINRGRAVLGCTLAHLIAWKRFTEDEFDVMIEDNVRFTGTDCAERIRETARASKEWMGNGGGNECHLRYYGWLGSIPNIRWMYDKHVPAKKFDPISVSSASTEQKNKKITVFPFPLKSEIEEDVAAMRKESVLAKNEEENCAEEDVGDKTSDREPGGNPVWGSYGYWISRTGYERLLGVLRNDVGAILWKSKRARYYTVKPVDKMLPRQIINLCGQGSVQLATHPAIFRAPMLTSKIHTKWDPEFCKSTEFQLQQSQLCWSDLLLTEVEQAIAAYHELHGEWITIHELEDKQGNLEIQNQPKIV